MKREIKFRAWDGLNEKFTYWTMNDLCTWDSKTEQPSALDIWLQFTGLKDKNGNEIYEGDVLQDEDGRKSIIESEMENNCGECGYVYGWDMPENKKEIGESFEVIGNIHENPELLK